MLQMTLLTGMSLWQQRQEYQRDEHFVSASADYMFLSPPALCSNHNNNNTNTHANINKNTRQQQQQPQWSDYISFLRCLQGRLSLSTVGDKCAKDIFLGGGGGIY